MHLFSRLFGPRRPGGVSKSRGPANKRRRLQFESLEARQVLSNSPFYIVNQTYSDAAKTQLTYSDGQIYLAVFASTFGSNPVYYSFDQTGAISPLAGQANVPYLTLSQLPIDSTTGNRYLSMPDNLNGDRGVDSGRIYFFMNSTPTLSVNSDGSVNAPSLHADAYYDSVEFTINDPSQQYRNLNLNLTSVDQYGVPLEFTIDSQDSTNPDHAIGTPSTTSRAMVVSMYQTFSQNSIFKASLDPDVGANGPYRILNPSHLLDNNTVTSQSVPVWVQTVLQNPITTTTQTLINVANVVAFPTPSLTNPFTVQIDQERMSVTGVSAQLQDGTYNWTVVRGFDGTNAATHTSQSDPVSQVNPAITATQTTLPVATGNLFPTPSVDHPFTILVDKEIMKVTGLTADNDGRPVWTVERGAFWTIPVEHNNGTNVYYNSAVASPFNSYFNAAIDTLFDTYSKTGVNIQLQSNGSGTETLYDGHVTEVNGCTVLEFWEDGDENGFKYDVYYPFFQDNRYTWQGAIPKFTPGYAPSWDLLVSAATLSPSSMVFSCNGVFADQANRTNFSKAQQGVVADLENQIVAALNRGVAELTPYASDPTGTWLDPLKYYGNNTTGQVWNQYAQFLHKPNVSIAGLNYGFAFDDKGAQSSDVGVDHFNSVTITLEPWAATAPPPPTLPARYSMRAFLASSRLRQPA
jgi:hypothetical protein